jgi:hypothetical protein
MLTEVAPSNDYTFATLKRFSDFDANILNIGIQGLEGCTVLTVVSRRAVYMVSGDGATSHCTMSSLSLTPEIRRTSLKAWHSTLTAEKLQIPPSSRTVLT